MPTLTYTLLIATLVSGCSSVRWARIDAPPSHSLLNVGEWRSEGEPFLTVSLTNNNTLGLQTRLMRNSRTISAGLFSRPAHEYDLLRALFKGTAQDALTHRISSLRQLAQHAELVTSTESKPGDILVFGRPGDDGPSIGIVISANRAGTLTAMAIHLGRAQLIKINRRLRSSRRHKGRVVNSFVRFVRPGDPAHKRYLAGDALSQVYRLKGPG